MRKRIGLLAAVIVAVAAGVGSASALISTEGRQAAGPNMIHPDGRGNVVAATTPDPESGRSWAVRVYGTTEGQTCAEVARAENGEFGQYDEAGNLQSLQAQGGGGCTDFAKSPVMVGVSRFPAREGHDARSVLSGLVTSDVQRLVLHTISGSRDLPIQHGAYVAVVNESELDAGARVEATLADGPTVSVPLGSSRLPEHALPSSDE
jgi:hypothetical protein